MPRWPKGDSARGDAMTAELRRMAPKLYTDTDNYVQAPRGLDAEAHAAWCAQATDNLLARNERLANRADLNLAQDAYHWLLFIRPNSETFKILPEDYERRAKILVNHHVEDQRTMYDRWQRELARGAYDAADLAATYTAEDIDHMEESRQEYSSYRPDTEDPQKQYEMTGGWIPVVRSRPAEEWAFYWRALKIGGSNVGGGGSPEHRRKRAWSKRYHQRARCAICRDSRPERKCALDGCEVMAPERATARWRYCSTRHRVSAARRARYATRSM
jgi:hypothetical protein